MLSECIAPLRAGSMTAVRSPSMPSNRDFHIDLLSTEVYNGESEML